MKNYIFLFACLLFSARIFGQSPVMDPIAGSATICSSPSALPSFTASASNAPTTYYWNVLPSAGVVITNSNSAVTSIFFPATHPTYTVYAAANNGSGMSTPVMFVVNVYEIPTVTFSGATSFCQGSSTILMASPTINMPNLSYSWLPPAGLNTTTGQFVVANPSVTTTYSVVTSNGQCAGTNTITLYTNPPITFSGSTSFCQGSSASLTAGPAGIPASSTISYVWLPPAGLNTNFGPNVIASPTVSTTYTVLLFDGGCVSSNTIALQTNPYAAVSGAGAFCQNASATLTANPANTPTSSSVTYSWIPSTGLNTTSGPMVIANPPNTTTYTVLLTDGGCTSASTVILNTSPSVMVSGPGSFCQGTSAVLSATPASPPANPNVQYSWAPATGLSNTNSPNVIASPTVSTIYTVTLTDGACSITSTIGLNTNALPVIAGASTVCLGASVTLSASPSAPNGLVLVYGWLPATGLNTTTGPNVVASPAASTTYTVFLNDGTCTSSNTITVHTNTFPFIYGPNSFCQGSSIAMYATPAGTPINSSLLYTWSPATGLNTTSGPNVIVSPTVTTTYSVILNDGGCTSMDTVTIYTNPLVHVSGAHNFCPGAAAALSATPVGSASSSSLYYSWTPYTGLNSIFGSNVSANPQVTTTYTVALNDGNCSSMDTITVFALPSVVFNGQNTFCLGTSTTLSVSLDGTQQGAVYSWAPAAGLNTIIGGVVVASPAVSTDYTVVASKNGCDYTGHFAVLTNDCGDVGIKNNTANSSTFILYPNPNNGTFIIKATKAETATLVDELGQILQTLTLQPNAETNISGLAGGVYFIVTPTLHKKIIVTGAH